MDIAACRRAAIESLSENLTDGFTSPIAWYVVAGLPGLVLFKVVSTMDSMVGNKTPRYLRFGWCGARTGRCDEFYSGAVDVDFDFGGGGFCAAMFGGEGAARRVEAARDFAGAEFGMERSGDGGRDSEEVDWADLDERDVGDGCLGGGCERSAGGEDETDVWRASVLVCATGLVFAAVAAGIVAVLAEFGRWDRSEMYRFAQDDSCIK